MGWLAIVSGIVKLAGLLAKWAGDRQLISAGESAAIAKGQETILADLAKIQASRAALADPKSGRAERLRGKNRRNG